MKPNLLCVMACLVWLFSAATAQQPGTGTHQDQATFQQSPSIPYDPATNPSGMYTFLKEGEFVQLTVDDGKLSGFISRFGDTDSDKGEFIDQFFDKASLEGDHLSFKTKTVHAVWYELDGTLRVVPGKKVGDEGFRVIAGKLTMHATDAKGNATASEKTVELKSFPDMRRP
jgi:hypothetical protein